MSPDCPLKKGTSEAEGLSGDERSGGVLRGSEGFNPYIKKMPDKNKPVVSVSFYFYVSRI